MNRNTALNGACAAAAAALLASLAGPAAHATMPGERSGQEVVELTCASCHKTGFEGAPRIGDAKAWEKRTAKGLSSLTGSALEGVRRMPPHGGNLGLTDTELKRAIAYMVNHSGGNWVEPIDRRAPVRARKGEQIVQAQCAKCHAGGLNGAPRIGDKEAWVQRAKLGFESVVRSAIHGHGAMPARGGMADLTDEEMRSAVAYMFQASVKPAK